MSQPRYDVFLSHNTADKQSVEELARRLVKEGITPWFDKWNLIPGERWQDAIENALDSCPACAVFIGPSGFGAWQDEEMRAAIDQRVSQRSLRVIPVLLPGAERGERSFLPKFLRAPTWVEFRSNLENEEALHRLISGIRGVPPGPGPGQAIYTGECPYRGLEVFDVQHAPFFFGRKALTDWLLTKLRPSSVPRKGIRLLGIIGPSGSGKSSLARAGVVAALKRGEIEGSQDWLTAISRPGSNPLESLAAALSDAKIIEKTPSAADDLIERMRSKDSMLNLATRLSLGDAPPERRLVLLVDQFEEIFTQCHDTQLRQALIDNLLYAATVPDGQIIVLLALRADFYGECANDPGLSAALSDHQLLVGPMTDDELQQAIERPAQMAGGEFEAGLIDTLIKDVRPQAGGLPLLQFALLELWERRVGRRLTHAAYREIEGVEGVLRSQAEKVFLKFNESEQRLCQQIFLRLTQVGDGTADTKRLVTESELLPVKGVQTQTEVVLHSLADARLITTSNTELPGGGRSAEIVHEALIRGWPRLRKWLKDDSDFLLWRQRLRPWLEEWKRSEAPLAGTLLTEAERWLAERREDLSPTECECIEASIQRQAREAQRWKELYENAERHRQIALARQLAAQSELIRGQRADLLPLGVLLAIESMVRAPSLEADQVLRRSMAYFQRPTATMSLSDAALKAIPGPQYAKQDYSARLWEVASRLELARLLHNFFITAVAFSPDGRYLATAGGSAPSTPPIIDNSARVWEVPGGRMLAQMPHEEAVLAIAFSLDGQYLITACADGTARVLEALTGKEIKRMAHEYPLGAVAISRDGKYLATASGQINRTVKDNRAKVWEIHNGQEVAILKHEGPVTTIAFSPDSEYLATGSEDQTARKWEITAGLEVARVNHSGTVCSVAFSPDGERLATGSADRTAKILEPTSGRERTIPHEGVVGTVLFSPDGRYLSTCEEGLVAHLWEADTGQETARYTQESGVRAIAFSSDGRYLATSGGHLAFSPDGNHLVTAGGSENPIALVWEVADRREAMRLVHSSAVRAVTFSPDGQYLVRTCSDGPIKIYDLVNSREADIADLPADEVVFSPAGEYLAIRQLDTVRVWETSNLHELRMFGYDGVVNRMAFSHNGRYLVMGYDNWTKNEPDLISNILLLDVDTWKGRQLPVRDTRLVNLAISPSGRHLALMITTSRWQPPPPDTVTALVVEIATSRLIEVPQVGYAAFSPDGDYLLTVSHPTTISILDMTNWQDVGRLSHPEAVGIRGWSPGGRFLVTAGARTVYVWEWSSQREVARMECEDRASIVTFSPNENYLATVSGALLHQSRDTSAHVWEVTSGREVARMTHDGQVYDVAFSPDGKHLATASGDRTVRLWLWQPEDLIAEATSRLTRNCTQAEWRQYLGDEPYRKTCPDLP